MIPKEVYVVFNTVDEEILDVSFNKEESEKFCETERNKLYKLWEQSKMGESDKKRLVEYSIEVTTLDKAIEKMKDSSFEEGRNF